MMPSMSYSTGSSVVMILSLMTLSSLRAEYSVVVLPAPVGPVTRMMPLGLAISWRNSASISPGMPTLLRSSDTTVRSSTRMTTLSPNMVGRMLTRKSTGLPPTFSSMRPSWGRRRSAMSRLDMTLMRLAMAAARWRGGGTISYKMPSQRERLLYSSSHGSEGDVSALVGTARREPQSKRLAPRGRA